MANDKDAWVKDFLGLDAKSASDSGAAATAAPAAASTAAQSAAKQPEMAAAAPNEGKEPSGGGPIDMLAMLPLGTLVAGAKEIFDTHVCHVSITNNTDLTLSLDPSSEPPESGKYKGKRPKKTLKPNDECEFEVDSKSLLGLSVGAVEGTVRYTSDTPKIVFACHYKNPRLASNDADASATPSDKYSTTANADSGDDAAFIFTFEGGSGGKGGDKPSGNNESGVAASCRVSVVNQTQQTVYLRKQDKAAGDYVSNPASNLAPGAKTDFVFAETPNSADHGCRGLMTWEVGDPKQATWDLMFDNVKGGKNLSASFLDPKDGGLHSLDQIDEGDENVPVTFTLSGAGGGQQPTGKPLTCVLTLNNKTNLTVSLLAASPDDGSFQAQPPTTIAPDGAAVVKMTGPADPTKPATGHMSWNIGTGQPGEPKSAVWAFEWTNPAGAKNTATGTVVSDLPGLVSQEEVGDGDQDVAYTFTIMGQADPPPPPPPAGGEPTSCAIMVTNSTQSVLTLSGQQATQGEFKKQPPQTLAAGASALMTFVGAKDAPDKGASGTMTWTMGNPAITTWVLSWNNPPGDGNTGTGDFNPKVAGLVSDASFPPKGDDDVPFTFVLSGNPAPPVQSTKTSCVISVTNNTQAPLTLVDQKPESGSFTKPPPGSLAVGQSAEMVFIGPADDSKHAGSAGSLTWQLGDDAASTWAMNWKNPPGDGNSAHGNFSAGVAGFNSSASCAPLGDEDVPFDFAVSSTAPPPVQSTKTSCVISVTNNTQAPLTLVDQKPESGSFMKPPPGSLAVGQSAEMVFIGPADDSKHAGSAGSLTWQLGDDAASTWAMNWKNPPGDGNSAHGNFSAGVAGFNSSASCAPLGDEDVPFDFAVSSTAPPPVQNLKTSCLITVKNDTKAALTLLEQNADSGSFTSAPPGSIAAGQSAEIGFAGPDDDTTQAGATGRLNWQIGDDAATTCLMQWSNPPGDANVADANVSSDDTTLTVSSVAGKGDENVPFTFDIKGGSDPEPEVDFSAPPKSKQPTLRKGDDSPDGWIEYAQTLLSRAKFPLTVNGKFDEKMHKAVLEFQAANNCQKDGTIGNETWSVLRSAKQKDAVGVDGRKPHSFEEKGAQARFFTEDSEFAAYQTKDDDFVFILMSPGEQKIDDFSITTKVIQKDGTSHTHKRKIGSDASPSPDGQGSSYRVEIKKFKSLFKLGKSDPAECTIDSYLDGEIGGDRWTGNVRVI